MREVMLGERGSVHMGAGAGRHPPKLLSPKIRLRKASSPISALVFGVLLLVALIAPETPAAFAQGDTILASGDRIRVTVFGQPDLSGEFEVDAAGFVSLPLIGKVAAAKGGVQRLEGAIEKKLLDGYLKNPRIGVEVLSLRAIFVLGEVGVPGTYPYSVGLTALKAVALAGGFSYRAKKNGLRVTRSSEPEKGEQRIAGGEVIFPGDIVVVPERFF